MQILEILNRHRNDFHAIIECEHLKATQFLPNGYDDENFWDNVMPFFTCLACRKNQYCQVPEYPLTNDCFLVEKIEVKRMEWVRK